MATRQEQRRIVEHRRQHQAKKFKVHRQPRALPMLFRAWNWFMDKFIKQPLEIVRETEFQKDKQGFQALLSKIRRFMPPKERRNADFSEALWLFYSTCLNPKLSFRIFDTQSERGFGVQFISQANRYELFGLLVPLRVADVGRSSLRDYTPLDLSGRRLPSWCGESSMVASSRNSNQYAIVGPLYFVNYGCRSPWTFGAARKFSLVSTASASFDCHGFLSLFKSNYKKQPMMILPHGFDDGAPAKATEFYINYANSRPQPFHRCQHCAH